MKYAALLILIGFAAISFFGFGSMAHQENHWQSGCIASFLDKTDCPPGSLDMIAGHMSVYKAFSQAGMASIFVTLVLAAVVAAFFWIKNDSTGSLAPLKIEVLKTGRDDPEPSFQAFEKIKDWLSLFENSPSRT